VVTQGVDARAFRGREVRLRAFLRTDVRGLTSQAQLWLRVDRAGGQRGFFDNMLDRPVRVRTWTEFEVKGSVADDAERIVFEHLTARRTWLDDVVWRPAPRVGSGARRTRGSRTG
jgi:hypothetical protein